MLSEIVISQELTLVSTMQSCQQEEQIVLCVGIEDEQRDEPEGGEAPVMRKSPNLRSAD